MIPRFTKHLGLAFAWCLCCVVCVLPARVAAQEQVLSDDGLLELSRDARQILSDNCYACHGFDAKQRQADLRLDTEEGAATVLDLENPTDSELLHRVFSDDDDLRMPPPEFNKSLATSQKETLAKWVKSGAPWAKHWSLESLRPPVYPAPPRATAFPATPHNKIDALVQAKLAATSRRPAPQAAKRTLIRRVTLDLTGLPPTPAQVDSFLNDQHPLAYERYVDRLLASPAFGERMAWNWLDAARYADTNGYQGDRERTMWPWRDWVIDAINRGMPFDQFTIWQLAGDLVPDATAQQKLATGFCRNHMINGEGGRIPEENRVDYVMDMTETMGTVWLGLTLNCCRCHDHKFDPIKQQEYYQLFAFFNQTPVTGGGGDPQTKPVIPAPSAAQRRREGRLHEELASAQSLRDRREHELASLQPGWEAEERAKGSPAGQWKTLKPVTATADHQSLKRLDDQSVLAEGPPVDNDNYTVTAITRGTIAAVRLESLQHDSHTEGTGLSRADSGNFVLTDFQLRVRSDNGSLGEPIPFASATATFEQGNLKAAAALDGNPKTGWAVYEGRVVNREHAARFVLKEPLNLANDSTLEFQLKHESVHQRHNLGRFRLSVSADADATLKQSPSWQQYLAIPANERTVEQRNAVVAAHRASDPKHRELNRRVANLEKQIADLSKSYAKVMVMEELDKPRTTFILDRGLYNKPLTEVTAQVPASLPPIPDKSADAPNRLSLAQWLVDDQHPLTARVTVNRMWAQLFGIGLVKTTEDFGVQGEIPLQIELLDALAWEFQKSGWDRKRIWRTIVTSHTYRQSSKISEEAFQQDPENRWLARGPRFRLPSWILRDQALAAAGLLVRQQGGPSVNPYQPAGVWEEATFGKKKYSQDHGEQLYRRSLYTFWRRIIGPTMFFDAASRQTCTVKAFRTNTPLHSLLTLNDVTYVEAARVLAGQVLTAEPNDRQRLNLAMNRLVARDATDREAEIFLPMATDSLNHYRQHPEAARALLDVGEFSGRDLDAALHAAWTNVCLALMNLDETLTKE